MSEEDAEGEFVATVLEPLADAFREAREKHGPGNTVQNPVMTDGKKLAILGEEFGEVCEALQDSKGKGLAPELLQVAAVALMWFDAVR